MNGSTCPVAGFGVPVGEKLTVVLDRPSRARRAISSSRFLTALIGTLKFHYIRSGPHSQLSRLNVSVALVTGLPPGVTTNLP